MSALVGNPLPSPLLNSGWYDNFFLLLVVLGQIANFDDSIHDLHELDEANNELNHDPNRDLANHDLQFMTHNS